MMTIRRRPTGWAEPMMTIRHRATGWAELMMTTHHRATGWEEPMMTTHHRATAMSRRMTIRRRPMMIGAASNAEPMKHDEATEPAWQRRPVLALRRG